MKADDPGRRCGEHAPSPTPAPSRSSRRRQTADRLAHQTSGRGHRVINPPGAGHQPRPSGQMIEARLMTAAPLGPMGVTRPHCRIRPPGGKAAKPLAASPGMPLPLLGATPFLVINGDVWVDIEHRCRARPPASHRLKKTRCVGLGGEIRCRPVATPTARLHLRPPPGRQPSRRTTPPAIWPPRRRATTSAIAAGRWTRPHRNGAPHLLRPRRTTTRPCSPDSRPTSPPAARRPNPDRQFAERQVSARGAPASTTAGSAGRPCPRERLAGTRRQPAPRLHYTVTAPGTPVTTAAPPCTADENGIGVAQQS